MKTSAVGTVKRRSMLPAPKSLSAGASVGASKSSDVIARKSKAATSSAASDGQPISLKVDSASTTLRDTGSESEGKLAGTPVSTVPGKVHSGTESRQSKLQKPSNLQQPATARKRPSSASSILNCAGREFGKTSQESGSSTKPAAVTRAAASAGDVDDQNAKKKQNGVFRGITSVSASQSTNIGTHEKRLPRLVNTTVKKLKVPATHVSRDAAVTQSSLSGSEIDLSCSKSENKLNAEPVIPTKLTTEVQVQEDADGARVLPECDYSNSVECRAGTTVGQECDCSESATATTVAGVPDVLSHQVTNDDSEHLASSTGSLGVLDDADLLDTSLLSFDSSGSTVSAAPAKETAGSCDPTDNPPDGKATPSVEPCFKQSPSTSETDPPVQSPTNEATMPSLRPLSLMSNSSADIGIVADCISLVSESCCQQERPSSYMSSSSADTGNSLFHYTPSLPVCFGTML